MRGIFEMIEKSRILGAWIMAEHLSEGDINTKDKENRVFDAPEKGDYYSFFLNEMENSGICRGNKSGIAVYFGIFGFSEVISMLRRQYGLKPTDEEISTGNKFTFALYFDKKLNYLSEMTFFTESGYIRYNKKVPLETEFSEYEEGQKKRFSQYFEGSEENAGKFNEAIAEVMKNFGISADKCRLRFLRNVETDAANLHSFFISDLEAAKNTDTENLREYLSGNTEGRVDLDSKKDSGKFCPDIFEKILMPENYPLGRFPSETEYALSFMQQAAVNLAIGYDNKTIRSVNGPPGTGKTTLLKDIFAELVTRQAYDMAKLSERCIKGTQETVYFNNASIGVLPRNISDNNIIVASSNNGAVQNIVNELPLIEKIDKAFTEEIMSADYFRDLANSEVSSEWENDHEKLTAEHNEGEDKFWGLFSLEGGRSANVNNILTNLKLAVKDLEEEYIPDKDIYADFFKQYDELKSVRDERQRIALGMAEYAENRRRLAKLKKSYSEEFDMRKQSANAEIGRLNSEIERLNADSKLIGSSLDDIRKKAAQLNEYKRAAEEQIRLIDMQKPGIMSSREEKAAYSRKIGDAADKLKYFLDEAEKCTRLEEKYSGELRAIEKRFSELSEKGKSLYDGFNLWNDLQKKNITELKEKIAVYSDGIGDAEPLDMSRDYDDLQLSNPWFDEKYRVAQSKLFIKALAVRKQFLYENRKNLKAAVRIWGGQNKYLDKKNVISAAWDWINLAIPVISSTFASFSRMCRNLGADSMGHLFIDEAGQAVPQATVGAVMRCRHVMAVGDPSQIKPVLTLDSSVLGMLCDHFGITEKYLSDSASVQTLADSASRFGFYREQDRSEDSWIGIPLWVHRRCKYPMFTISNMISYNGFMVQGKPGNGKAGWYDVRGKANNKYVEEQGEFLARKISEMAAEDPKILDKNAEDIVYVISPFSNVAFQLAQRLKKIGFTRYENGKPTNVGTVHTFQGKEAPVVFMVLGADRQSSGAASWSVGEPNMMNVAATRAKQEFYIIGDRELYLGIGSDVAMDTYKIIKQYKKEYPELAVMTAAEEDAEEKSEPRIVGTVVYVGMGKTAKYAYIKDRDGKKYTVTEGIFSETENADNVIVKDKRVSFSVREGEKYLLAYDIRSDG